MDKEELRIRIKKLEEMVDELNLHIKMLVERRRTIEYTLDILNDPEIDLDKNNNKKEIHNGIQRR